MSAFQKKKNNFVVIINLIQIIYYLLFLYDSISA